MPAACGFQSWFLYRKTALILTGDRFSYAAKAVRKGLFRWLRAAIQAVFDYLEQRDCFIREGRRSIWLFPSKSSRSGHISRDTFFKRLKELAVKAGIYPSRVTPHVLRHSFATHLLNHNADLRSVQKMLGHESINTTEIYTHILSDKLLETVQKLHPLAGKHS